MNLRGQNAEKLVRSYRRSRLTWGFWWRALSTLGLYVLLLWDKNKISVTTRRVVQRTGGVIGGTEVSVGIENITDVQIEKPPLGALFDYGNVVVQTAGSSSGEIKFDSLGKPESMRNLIFDLKDGKIDGSRLSS